MSDRSSGIDFIICGLEHSGTTLVSDIFRQHPGCDSGFEIGVLLKKEPNDFKDFKPFYNNMLSGWGLTEEDLATACNSPSLSGFYETIYQYSSIPRIRESTIRFDKTPRYITQLKAIATSLTTPIVAVIKDPRSIAVSDYKRNSNKYSSVEDWYLSWFPQKHRYMKNAYQGYQFAWSSPQCLVVRLEDLCLNTRLTMESMFQHVGLRFSLDYLDFPSKRTHHTVGTTVNPLMAFSFRKTLDPTIQERILSDFSDMPDWFYDFG